jgi:hypothetical protein
MASKFLIIPIARSFDLINVNIMGRISYVIRLGEQTSIKLTMCSDSYILT